MAKKYIDMVGQKFGEWIVLEKSNKKVTSHAIFWKCQCSCGTIAEIAGTDLRAGKTTKCKCHKANLENRPVIKRKVNQNIRHNFNDSMIGKKFGKLQVLEKDCVKIDGTYVKCKCDCGNITIVRWSNLVSGKTQSCGCTKSRGEEKIALLLQNNNIDFKQQYSFSDLKGPNNGLLRFDFAIFKNEKLVKLIEYQGEFHYQDPPKGWTDVRESDKLKQEYCLKHGIPLLLISYLDFDNINIDQLIG